jgi:hypothetical protein
MISRSIELSAGVVSPKISRTHWLRVKLCFIEEVWLPEIFNYRRHNHDNRGIIVAFLTKIQIPGSESPPLCAYPTSLA